jgi:hypothetical protein
MNLVGVHFYLAHLLECEKHTGDMAVWDHESYIQIVDRQKDTIMISGGRNISSIEVERAIAAHPAVLPKTGTGSIVKRPLRETFWGGKEKRIQG